MVLNDVRLAGFLETNNFHQRISKTQDPLDSHGFTHWVNLRVA